MNESEIRAHVAGALAGIAPEADLATVGDDDDLREALELDSMDFLNFVIALSQRSGVKIPEVEAPKLHTMRALVAYFSSQG